MIYSNERDLLRKVILTGITRFQSKNKWKPMSISRISNIYLKDKLQQWSWSVMIAVRRMIQGYRIRKIFKEKPLSYWNSVIWIPVKFLEFLSELWNILNFNKLNGRYRSRIAQRKRTFQWIHCSALNSGYFRSKHSLLQLYFF